MIEWSTEAERDLFEIYSYIAQDDPVAALNWIDRLRDRARKAARFPNAGREVPEADDPSMREVFLGNYRIIYWVQRRGIRVLTVIEGHRRLRRDPIDD